jgi:prepilin-type processing-associated H-X9-DG protein
MYLTDYDRLWPHERRAEVVSEFWDLAWSTNDWCQQKNLDKFNPYLRVLTILDEYVKNREVWRCPSARSGAPFYVLNPYGGDWWPVARDFWQSVGCCVLPCSLSFPPGWGGSITDSIAQGSYGSDTPGAFEQSVCTTASRETKTSQMDDPAKFFVCGDGGAASKGEASGIGDIAWPDICRMGMSNPYCGCYADPDCGVVGICAIDPSEDDRDPQVRKRYTRHMGGSNVGFADGHAQWFSSEALLVGCYDNPMGWRDWLIPADRREQWKSRPLIITGGLDLGICGFPSVY